MAPDPVVPGPDGTARLDQASFEGHPVFDQVDIGAGAVLSEASSGSFGFWRLTCPWRRLSRPAGIQQTGNIRRCDRRVGWAEAPDPVVPGPDRIARLDQASFEGHPVFDQVDIGAGAVPSEASSGSFGFWRLTCPGHRLSLPARLR